MKEANLEKLRRLKQLKQIATGVLILMTVVFLISKLLEKQYPSLAFLRAFSEAAMIGALADWFAVVALFRHPLGLKIPHTNLIATKQQNIGKNLGNFVTNNFLAEHTLADKVANIKISEVVGTWLSQPQNTLFLSNELAKFLPELLESLNEEEINGVIKNRANQFVQNTNFSAVASDALQYFTNRGQHQILLDNGIIILKQYLETTENREWLYEKFRQRSSRFIPSFVDDFITDKILNAVIDALQEIYDDKFHPLRDKFDVAAEKLVEDLKHSPEYKEKIEEMKTKLISGKAYQNYTQNLWGNIKQELLREIQSENSSIRQKIQQGMDGLGERLINDTDLKNKIDEWVRKEVMNLLRTNKDWISQHISQTVQKWDKREISDKLELEVGRDLQFIRLNGTLVGGLVGLLLYILFDCLW